MKLLFSVLSSPILGARVEVHEWQADEVNISTPEPDWQPDWSHLYEKFMAAGKCQIIDPGARDNQDVLCNEHAKEDADCCAPKNSQPGCDPGFVYIQGPDGGPAANGADWSGKCKPGHHTTCCVWRGEFEQPGRPEPKSLRAIDANQNRLGFVQVERYYPDGARAFPHNKYGIKPNVRDDVRTSHSTYASLRVPPEGWEPDQDKGDSGFIRNYFVKEGKDGRYPADGEPFYLVSKGGNTLFSRRGYLATDREEKNDIRDEFSAYLYLDEKAKGEMFKEQPGEEEGTFHLKVVSGNQAGKYIHVGEWKKKPEGKGVKLVGVDNRKDVRDFEPDGEGGSKYLFVAPDDESSLRFVWFEDGYEMEWVKKLKKDCRVVTGGVPRSDALRKKRGVLKSGRLCKCEWPLRLTGSPAHCTTSRKFKPETSEGCACEDATKWADRLKEQCARVQGGVPRRRALEMDYDVLASGVKCKCKYPKKLKGTHQHCLAAQQVHAQKFNSSLAIGCFCG